MIVKLQRSLVTRENKEQMFLYNEDRSVCYQGALTSSVRKLMNGKNKVHVEADLKNGLSVLNDIVPNQEW